MATCPFVKFHAGISIVHANLMKRVFTSIKWLNAVSFIRYKIFLALVVLMESPSKISSLVHPIRMGIICNSFSSSPANNFKALCQAKKKSYNTIQHGPRPCPYTANEKETQKNKTMKRTWFCRNPRHPKDQVLDDQIIIRHQFHPQMLKWKENLLPPLFIDEQIKGK